MKVNVLILAAGKGTRMKSDLSKVAHLVAGKPIVSYVVDTVSSIENLDSVNVVVGYQSELIRSSLNYANVTFIEQLEQLGTGHAVVVGRDHFSGREDDLLIVLPGDCPLVEQESLEKLISLHQESDSSASILTTHMADPAHYGRILRAEMGTVVGIREAKDCTSSQLEITEINTGIYCFNIGLLFKMLDRVTTDNSQKEYYLTDVIHLLKESGHIVSAYCTPNSEQVIGVNTRQDLALINKVLYARNNDYFMLNGVTIVDPNATFIDSTVSIGSDTIIHPFTVIQGETVIGQHCEVFSHSVIRGGTISDNHKVPPFSCYDS